MSNPTRTLIIRHDSDLRGSLEADAAEYGYNAEATLQTYLDEVERLALEELEVDDVDVERIDAGGATPSSSIEYSDGSEMTWEEREALRNIQDRAMTLAVEVATMDTCDTPDDIEWLRDGNGHTYQVCCYGPEGNDLGENYTRIGAAGGQWYIDEGDDAVRVQTFGPFSSRQAALAASAALASKLDESEVGE